MIKNKKSQGDYVQGDKIDGDKVTGNKIAVQNMYIQSGEQPPLWINVPSLPTSFVGREMLVDDFACRLTAGNAVALSIEGLPGVGKTTLAVALAYHKKTLAHFKDGVLWAGVGHNGDVSQILTMWATGLGEDIARLTTVKARQTAVKRLIGHRNLLLVIDDVWQAEDAHALHCGGPGCAYLLTTQDKMIARQFAGIEQTIHVPVLGDNPAFALLQTLAPESCIADPTAARGLAEAVGGLPLAIELLGGYLGTPERNAFPDLSKAALAEMADPARRLQLAKERFGKRVTLAETIQLSVESLPPIAVAAFYALGAFAPKPESFSRAAAEATAQTDAATLGLLGARNLLEINGGRLALHQTLADAAVASGESIALAAAHHRHRTYYVALANEDKNNWQWIESAYGQIRWAWNHCPDNESLLDMVWALRIYQSNHGLWRDKINWIKRTLAITRALKLYEDEGILLNNIGLVYDNMGEREKALAYYNQSLPIKEKVGDRGGLATTLNNIGLVYYNLGQLEKALEHYNQALPIMIEVGNQFDFAITLNNIGVTYSDLKQWEKALEYCAQALILHRNLGNQAMEATTLNNIGSIYDKMGEQKKALEHYNQALPIMKETGNRNGLATTLNNVGTIHHSRGEWEKAFTYYNRGLLIRKEVGDQHGESMIRYNIARIYQEQERLALAVAELHKVVKLDRLVQNPNLAHHLTVLQELEGELTST